jgi:DNA-binding NarL/FixJ family response regulator
MLPSGCRRMTTVRTQTMHPTPAIIEAPTMPPHRWHILIVDHDPAAALITQHGLRAGLGVAATVDVAPSPGAAWVRCVRTDVDLLIVDPYSRNRASTVLIKALREARPDLPMVVLTAYDTLGMRREMLALGVGHYLAKPIELTALEQCVRSILE